MIRKIKLYIALVAVLLSASSCLDKYPQDAIPQDDAIKTVSDVRQALIGIYAQFKNSSLYSGYLEGHHQHQKREVQAGHPPH